MEAFYVGSDPALMLYHKDVLHSANAHVFTLPTQYVDEIVKKFRSGYNSDIDFTSWRS